MLYVWWTAENAWWLLYSIYHRCIIYKQILADDRHFNDTKIFINIASKHQKNQLNRIEGDHSSGTEISQHFPGSSWHSYPSCGYAHVTYNGILHMHTWGYKTPTQPLSSSRIHRHFGFSQYTITQRILPKVTQCFLYEYQCHRMCGELVQTSDFFKYDKFDLNCNLVSSSWQQVGRNRYVSNR